MSINKDVLYKEYIVTHRETEQIFILGPVYSVTSFVKRIEDNKNLGKVITYSKSGGWLSRLISQNLWGQSL